MLAGVIGLAVTVIVMVVLAKMWARDPSVFSWRQGSNSQFDRK